MYHRFDVDNDELQLHSDISYASTFEIPAYHLVLSPRIPRPFGDYPGMQVTPRALGGCPCTLTAFLGVELGSHKLEIANNMKTAKFIYRGALLGSAEGSAPRTLALDNELINNTFRHWRR